MLLNKENKKMLERYPKVIEGLIESDGGNDDKRFSKLRKEQRKIEKYILNQFGVSDTEKGYYDFVNMLIHAIEITKIESPIEIIFFKDFAQQLDWDDEKIELFHRLNPRCNQRKEHLKKWHSGFEYIHLENFDEYEFIIR